MSENPVRIDLGRLSPNIIKEVEERTGHGLTEFQAPGAHIGDMLCAIAYAVLRRRDPNITPEQAAERDDIEWVNSGVPPTNAGGSGRKPR